uniref:Pyrin domain-containing protein n=1 Tax=Terrapene triunguis TaxID=2587831 RepID=A0A674IZS6_9SAUR
MGEQLLHILDDLSVKEFEKFKFYLPHGGTAPHIRRGKLDGASRIQVAELLMQTYPQEALDITNQVLRKIPRLDLVQGGQLQTGGETGNCAFSMLLEWRKRAKQDATAIHLCTILSQDGVPLQPEALDCLRDTGSA